MVVELDVRDHADLRRELEERAVGLVGLDDEPLARAVRGVRARGRCSPGRRSSPPMTNVGSQPSDSSACAAIDAVVVLPCVPAIAIVRRRRLSSPSSAPRWISRSPRSRAGARSGFARADRRRDDELDVVAGGTLAASWPTSAAIPAARTRSR